MRYYTYQSRREADSSSTLGEPPPCSPSHVHLVPPDRFRSLVSRYFYLIFGPEDSLLWIQQTITFLAKMDVQRYPFTDFVAVTQVKSRKTGSGGERETFRSGRLWMPTGARGVFGGQV